MEFAFPLQGDSPFLRRVCYLPDRNSPHGTRLFGTRAFPENSRCLFTYIEGSSPSSANGNWGSSPLSRCPFFLLFFFSVLFSSPKWSKKDGESLKYTPVKLPPLLPGSNVLNNPNSDYSSLRKGLTLFSKKNTPHLEHGNGALFPMINCAPLLLSKKTLFFYCCRLFYILVLHLAVLMTSAGEPLSNDPPFRRPKKFTCPLQNPPERSAGDFSLRPKTW